MPTQNTTGPPFTITGLTPGGDYTVRVRAVNAAGASAWTSLVGFTTDTAAGGGDPYQSLSRFRLQLPTGSDGAIDQIDRDTLVAGYSSTYFQPTADGQGFRFHVPADGATTSGTSFPRTELREVDPDGSTAGWHPSDGITRRLTARIRVNYLPDADPEITLFQIHNEDTEVVTFRTARIGAGTIRVAVRKNGLTITSPTVTQDYQWGTDFTIDVEVTPTTVTVSGNGSQITSFPVSDLTLGPNGLFYFKVGAYAQFNETSVAASEYAETELRDLVFTYGATAQARLKPTNATQSAMDSAITSAWAAYKTAYVRQNSAEGWYGVQGDAEGAAFFPESTGYGMLLAAQIDGTGDKAIFDGLAKFALDHPSSIESRFMGGTYTSAWAYTGAGMDSATDGDLDIALGFLIAHRRWGTSTTINGSTYQQHALNRIAGLKASGFSPIHALTKLGDWSSGSWDNTSRPSDWMVGHFEAFHAATGDTFWSTAASNHLEAAADVANGTTGLIPDFATGTSRTTLSPGPANVLESANDDDYYYNSCRVPWRMSAADAAGAVTRAQTLSAWAKAKCGGSPSTLPTGYQLDGTTLSGGTYQDQSFIAPFMAAAAVGDDQTWLNSLWSYCSGNTPGNYFADSIRLLCMIQVSQTYWVRDFT